MIILKLSKQYESKSKKFIKKNPQKAAQIKKTIQLFLKNPKIHSLNTEKLKGNEIWTMRIDLNHRIFFIWENKNTILLIDIGKHDKYRKY